MKTIIIICVGLLFSTTSFSQIEFEFWKEGGLILPEWYETENDSSGTTHFIYYDWPELEVSIAKDKATWGGEQEPLAGPYMEEAVSQFLSDKGISSRKIYKLTDKNLLKIFAIYPTARYTNSVYGYVYNLENNICYRIKARCTKCIDANLKNYMSSINLLSNFAYWGVNSWINVWDINEEQKVIFTLDSLVRDSFGSPQDWDFYVKHISNDYQIIRAYELEDHMINIAVLPLGRNVEINFLDEETGFLYGYLTGYGFYSFIYKTTDGGASWRKIPRSGGFGKIDDAGLYMFDQQRGILIPEWRDPSKLRYYLTADGGETWQRKEIKVLSKREGYNSTKEKVMMGFNPEGEVCLSLIRSKDQSYLDYHLVLYSSNFGKSFKVIKGWKKLDDR